LGEHAAREFYEKHKDEIKWGLVKILPAIIVGISDGLKSYLAEN